jgi:hypothetical protein
MRFRQTQKCVKKLAIQKMGCEFIYIFSNVLRLLPKMRFSYCTVHLTWLRSNGTAKVVSFCKENQCLCFSFVEATQ